MKDYIEDYTYNNCFWMKSGLLYKHSEGKFKEYLSVGEMIKKFSIATIKYYEELNIIPTLYKRPDEQISTCFKGITAFIEYINLIAHSLKELSKDIDTIQQKIFELEDGYKSRKRFLIECENDNKKYQEELGKLKMYKDNYFESINKAIEVYLELKKKGKEKTLNHKFINDIENKKKDYKNQIEKVEQVRVNYMSIQGNIFSFQEEVEKSCTNDLREKIKLFINSIEIFKDKLIISDSQKKIINAIDGESDIKQFAENNKSLMTGPKRNLYKEYSQDINYYIEHFDFLRKKTKGKNSKEIRQMHNQISQDVTAFLNNIIKEEPNQINEKILEIASKLKDSKCEEKDYQYLINKFQDRYNQFLVWKKKNVGNQDYRKVGAEWDDRFCYMHTFLGYFNKTRVGNKELDITNFNYLCQAIIKILELNENEDIDYSLCDLVVILSSTFFTRDNNSKNFKKYVTDVIKKTSIMQSQGFWVGLTKYELNEEIQQQKKEIDTLDENSISEEKINNSITAKLMSVTYNIMQFIMDSKDFNRIVSDIFKYCKINNSNREIVVSMMESQIEAENLTHIKLDQDLLLSETK